MGLTDVSPRALARLALKSPGYRKRFSDLAERVGEADLIVVVANVPESLSRHGFANIELLRRRLPGIPIVNYELIYLPTVEKMGRRDAQRRHVGYFRRRDAPDQAGAFRHGAI